MFNRELLKGATTSLVMKIIGLILATLFAFIVARTLGAEAWGAFSLALSLLSAASIISVFGFDTYLLKISSSRSETNSAANVYRKTVWITSILSALSATLLYFSAPVIASHIFKNPELSSTFKIASFAIPPYVFINIHAGLLQGYKKIRKYVFIRFVSHHAGGLLLFLLLLSFQTANQSVILAYTISLYVVAILSLWWVKSSVPAYVECSSEEKSTFEISELLIKGLPFMLASLLFFLKGWIDTIMIGVFMNETNVGIYNITLKLTAVLGISLSAVSAVSTPFYSEAYSSGNIQKLKEHVSKSSAIVFYSSLPIFLILILFPGPILSLFGDEFTAGTTALIILAAGGFINAYFGAAGYLMNMTGSEVILQYITLAAVLIGILLNYVLIPLYGLTGAASATTLTIAGWNIACALYIKRVYSVHVFYIPGIQGTVRKWLK
jgi:O-antigen/teichoic acid export membrane protein